MLILRYFNFFALIGIFSLSVSCNDNSVYDFLNEFGDFVSKTKMMYDNDQLDDKTWKECELKFMDYIKDGKKYEAVKHKMSEGNKKTYEDLVKDFNKIRVKKDPWGHIPEFLGF